MIRLGNNGPEFAVTTEYPEASELDRTLVIPAGIQLPAASSTPETAQPADGGHEGLLSEAVRLARRARAEGRGDQTLMLMRDVLSHALRRNTSRFRLTIVLLVAALLGTGAFSFWKLSALRREKLTIDARIRQIEIKLEKDETPQEAERLISELSTYQDEARSLERNVLYRYAVRQQQNFITNEIRAIMAEFGAETYSVPPEFEQGVIQYIERYKGPDRPLMERALNQATSRLTEIRAMLEAEKLPPDLAYIPLVESALASKQVSAAGAAGPWQLTPATARALGLRVDAASGRATRPSQVDPRRLPLPAQPDSGLWFRQLGHARARRVQSRPYQGEASRHESRGRPHQAAQFLVSLPCTRAAGRDARVRAQRCSPQSSSAVIPRDSSFSAALFGAASRLALN